ncbi:hypothetical protein [Sharpea azabuensis]|uniref:hypothetical protein n=1 Tax=Sharpea azabuensis TaxID=322505 RepID=UPI00156822F6|nr:hypothetical protein [Sharpea azabuensis]
MVTDDFIDGDIKLMHAAYDSYKNPAINEMLTYLGINKGSNEHKAIVQRATRTLIDIDNISELVNKNNSEIDEFVENLIYNVSERGIDSNK